MPAKSWRDKLKSNADLPKVEIMDGKASLRFGPGTMVIPSPLEVDQIMRTVPEGRLITTDIIRQRLAVKHGATVTCPLCTGMFAKIAAYAAEEEHIQGSMDITPYWRTLKAGGELNEKYPGGIDHQKVLLEMEGFTIKQKGKRAVIEDYESYVVPV